MPDKFVYRPSVSDADHAEQIREIIKQSLDVLRQPRPDTFLGRKTHEPFSEEGISKKEQ